MFVLCNIVRENQKKPGQSQAETDTISHSTMDTDKATASDNRSWDTSLCDSLNHPQGHH